MTITSPGPLRATERHEPPSPRVKTTATERQGRRKINTAAWYVTLLIGGTLLLATGWEIFRLLLAIITLD
jgi:hypothetical protein